MGTQIKAEIVAHSINEQGDELISVLATFPRIILAEVNTHRMLSKNTSSSRAIPFKKMVETIQNDPFIPIAWQKDHKGMQGTEYFVENMQTIPFKTIGGFEFYANSPLKDINYKWLKARDRAIETAFELNSIGVTKQLANRLLEPFMWTTMLITGPKSGWENFFHLRCPNYQMMSSYGVQHYKSKKDFLKSVGLPDTVENYQNWREVDWLKINKGQAEIHMMQLAECIWDAYNESTPKVLKAGEWHIPFEDKMGFNFVNGSSISIEEVTKIKVSVAMAARTSYTVVGEEKTLDYEAMIGLHDRLLAQDPPHSSPLEHCAKAMNMFEHTSFIKGKLHNPEFQDSEGEVIDYLVGIEEKSMGWCNNFKGFIPYRYMVDNAQL